MKKRPSTAKWRGAAALAAVLLAVASLPGAQKNDKKKTRTIQQALLYGSVFQESGVSLRGARVVAFNAERPNIRKETVTDVQGEFAVRFPAGKARYTIEVSAEGFTSEKKTVEVAGDERVDLTFRLSPVK
jgi:hypothetical protein